MSISQTHDHHDYASTLTALRELSAVATARQDALMEWTTRLMVGRLAMLQNDHAMAAKVMTALALSFGLPKTNDEMEKQDLERQSAFDSVWAKTKPENATEKDKTAQFRQQEHDEFLKITALSPFHIPKGLLIQFLVLLSLYQAQMGEMKVAKQTVKRAHVLLDAPIIELGEDEGWVSVSAFCACTV